MTWHILVNRKVEMIVIVLQQPLLFYRMKTITETMARIPEITVNVNVSYTSMAIITT